MKIIYNYITRDSKVNNLLNKINILDLGENKNDLVDIFRDKMYICSYDLLYFKKIQISKSYDEDKERKFNFSSLTYNNTIKYDIFFEKNINKKYNFIIIHNNLKEISEEVFGKGKIILNKILERFLFLLNKNGFIFIIVDKYNQKLFNLKHGFYCEKKLKCISSMALNKEKSFKNYLFLFYKV
jgi:hypothetical protein